MTPPVPPPPVSESTIWIFRTPCLFIDAVILPGGLRCVLPNSAAAATILAQQIAHDFNPVARQFFFAARQALHGRGVVRLPWGPGFFHQKHPGRVCRGEPNPGRTLWPAC